MNRIGLRFPLPCLTHWTAQESATLCRLFTGNRSTRQAFLRTRISSILHPISAAIGCGKAGNRCPERKRISPTAGKGLFKPEYQRAFMPQCGQLR